MKILHLSDTHGKHKEFANLPEADIIIHSGDFTFAGSDAEAYDFLNWFIDLPYRHKIFIAGNHDECMYGAENIEGLPDNVHYLCNSGVEIEGIKFYGVPLFMEDCMAGTYEAMFEKIPEDTDVLITHQPPFGHCDLADYGKGLTHRGNKALAERVKQLHLHYHLFGHEHDANQTEKFGNTVFSNAAVLDNAYHIYAQPKLFVYK